MTLLSSPATWKIAHKRRTFAEQINLHASSRGFVLQMDHPAHEFADVSVSVPVSISVSISVSVFVSFAAVTAGLIGRSGVNCSATTAITMRDQ